MGTSTSSYKLPCLLACPSSLVWPGTAAETLFHLRASQEETRSLMLTIELPCGRSDPVKTEGRGTVGLTSLVVNVQMLVASLSIK